MEKRLCRKNGFTLVEIMIVVAIIGMLAAIAIPNLNKARIDAQSKACINNLRMIDDAKGLWALQEGKSGTATPTGADIKPYLGRGQEGTLPCCPADSSKTFATSYSVNNLVTAPTCISSGTTTNHVLVTN